MTAAVPLATGFVGLSLDEVAALAGIAGVAALAVGLCGALVLRLLRSAPFSAQVSAVALTSVAAVGGGAVAAGSAMFLSAHDLQALLVIVGAAAVVGVLVALGLARRAGVASRSIGRAARRLADEGSPVQPEERVSIREFAALAAELRDTAARLEQARARERAVEAARRQLIAWVSHDLRTPLAGIRAVAEALEDEVVTEPDVVREYHATLRLEADRLTALVDDLFELNRIAAGALRLKLERVNLGELVSDALVAVAPLASAKGVRLENHANGEAPELSASVPELVRVLRNLLENAVRETPSQGSVEVEAGVDGDRAFVAVRDTCGGIPQADLPRVFETSFRGSTARTPTLGTGAGLGLAIARGLVEAHEGDISVGNRGRGCEFRIRLPLAT